MSTSYPGYINGTPICEIGDFFLCKDNNEPVAKYKGEKIPTI